MDVCKFCGTLLPENAYFCGSCGKGYQDSTAMATRGSGLRAVRLFPLDTRTMVDIPRLGHAVPVQPEQILDEQDRSAESTTLLDQCDEEEEEQRRRAALLGVALPLVADVQSPAEHVPTIHGAPQFKNALMVHGTPQLGSTPPPATPPAYGPVEQYADPTVRTAMPPARPSHYYGTPTHHLPTAHRPSGSPFPKRPSPAPHPPTSGCVVWLIILIIPILILAGTFALGTTLLAPTLSLSGSGGVVLGGSLQLHGSNFMPASAVILTLDDAVPLYYTNQHTLRQAFHSLDEAAATMTRLQLPIASNRLTVGGNGTFDVTIVASQNWGTGKHTIRASEQFTLRGATLWFTTYQPATTPTPFTTPTPTPKEGTVTPTATALPKPTSTPSPTSTAKPSGLSSVTPGTITLGPVSDGYTSTLSTQVMLNTAGSTLVQWSAVWNQSQAPWLQLDRTTGQLQAPTTQPITISAVAKGLSVGKYMTTVVFTSPQSSKSVTLTVSLIIQAGCVSVTPATLNFTGTVGTSDPSVQPVAVNNCGASGTWAVSATTDTDANWLSISPTSGNVQGGGTQQATIAVSIAQLGTGTYHGKLLFTSGSGQFVVFVTLTVQALPTLNVSLTSISVSKNCTFNQAGYWACFETLSSSQNSQVNLNWTATSNGLQGITISPASGTLTPGQSVQVEIDVPRIPCETTATLAFTGPANTITVSVAC